jgi:uncharacterized protein (TIGR02284 family)
MAGQQEMRTQVHTLHHTLEKVYRIAEAGEKGFATAAVNMPNPALKIICKLYAQQRMNFKTQLLEEMRRLGATSRPGASIPGAIHRGRVAIFAGMASGAGQERIILKEAALGERVAVRTYQEALTKELPTQTRQLLERQFADVRQVSEQIHCLRDDAQQRAAMQLSGSEQDTRQAIQTLIRGGLRAEEIETLDLHDQVLYQGQGATLIETILSGAFGGALWGGLVGLLVGFGVVQTTSPVGLAAILLTWLLAVLGFLLVGALISGVLAMFIAVSISGEDHYQYPVIRENARVLVLARACAVRESPL